MNRRAGIERKAIVRFLRFRSEQAKKGAITSLDGIGKLLDSIALAIEAGAHNDLVAPDVPEMPPSLWITAELNAFTVPPLERSSQLYVHSSRLEDALQRLTIVGDIIRTKTEAVEMAQCAAEQERKVVERAIAESVAWEQKAEALEAIAKEQRREGRLAAFAAFRKHARLLDHDIPIVDFVEETIAHHVPRER